MADFPIYITFEDVLFPATDFAYATRGSKLIGPIINLYGTDAPTLMIHLKDGTDFKFYGPTLEDFTETLRQEKDRADGY